MPVVSVSLDDSQFLALSEHARNRSMGVDELVRENIGEFLKRQIAFQAAAKKVLIKNEELYSRLAQ